MKKARILYTENYDGGREGYIVESNVGDGWELDSFFPLVASAKNPDEDAKFFVHFSIINKLAQLQAWGYDVTIR